MPDDLLDRALYSYSEVDRLVGLSAGTAHRWLEGYELRRQFYQPVLRPGPTGAAAVTWGELVEAWLLAEFRLAVPVRRLRPAVVRLRDELGPYPLVRARPFLEVEGRELVRIVHDQDGLTRWSRSWSATASTSCPSPRTGSVRPSNTGTASWSASARMPVPPRS